METAATLLARWRYYIGSIPPMLRASRRPVRLAAAMGGLGRGGFVWELRSGESFRVRSPLDAWIVKETWVDRAYDAAGTPVEDGWTVLDVGAGIGDFTVQAAKASPSGRVFAFEPAEDAFALLEENLARNGVRNAVAHREAIGAPGEVAALETTTSVRSRTVPVDSAGAREAVPTSSLDEVFARLGLATCDLLKMDVEGAEERILLGTSAETLLRVRRLVLEVHEEEGTARGSLLARRLEELGFGTTRTPNPAWPRLSLLYARR